MHLDRQPIFRKRYIPWYDTAAACWLLIGILFLVFLFALSGVAVAWSEPDLAEHAWFPGVLAGLSIFLMVKIVIRLWRRNRKD